MFVPHIYHKHTHVHGIFVPYIHMYMNTWTLYVPYMSYTCKIKYINFSNSICIYMHVCLVVYAHILLGAMQLSFVPGYERLSNRSLWAQTCRYSLTWQWPGNFGTAQNIAGTSQPACFLLSHNIDESLGGFQCHFVTHAWDRCVSFLETPFFFLKYFPLKFFGRRCFSDFLFACASCFSRPWELSWFRVDRTRGTWPLFMLC